MHARCQLSKRGGKERDEKARAQVKDDEAQVGIGAGFHGQNRNGGEYCDAEHDEPHITALGKVKDDAGDETARCQKEAWPGLHGDGAVGVGERDYVIEGGEQTGENHDERNAPARLLGEGMRGFDKGVDGVARALVCRLGSSAQGGDDDRRRSKNDELCDAAAVEQVKGELHQNARGVCRSCTGGELGIVLERHRERMVRRSTQQAESEECEAPQNLERKRARGELYLGQSQDGDGDGGAGNCLGLAFTLCEPEQWRVSDKADNAGTQDKALRDHYTLGTGEQPDIDIEAKLGGKKDEGKERECQKRVDFSLAQVQERSFGWTEQSCPRL